VSFPEPNLPNLLEEALEITQGDRQADYGSPFENWLRTSEIFNAMTGLGLTPVQCVDMAIAMKLARLFKTPNHRDSMKDLAGYAWVRSEVVAGWNKMQAGSVK